jgi:hypothetical protein
LTKLTMPRARERTVAKVSHGVESVDPYSRMWRLEDRQGAGAPGSTYPISPIANPQMNPINFPPRHEHIVVDSDCFIPILSRR